MKAGLVCPYGWDVPGGVQERVRDLAEALMDQSAIDLGSRAAGGKPLPAAGMPRHSAGQNALLAAEYEVCVMSLAIMTSCWLTPSCGPAGRRPLTDSARGGPVVVIYSERQVFPVAVRNRLPHCGGRDVRQLGRHQNLALFRCHAGQYSSIARGQRGSRTLSRGLPGVLGGARHTCANPLHGRCASGGD
jgi:hypothetical protein